MHLEPAKSVHDYYSRLQIVFKENSGLPIDVESIQLAFNSIFINGLKDLPLTLSIWLIY